MCQGDKMEGLQNSRGKTVKISSRNTIKITNVVLQEHKKQIQE